MDLPRYVSRIQRKTGAAYYFVIPKRLRPEGWPKTIRLPKDKAKRTGGETEIRAVIADAEKLNEKLDAARQQDGTAAEKGTLPWLMADWRRQAAWTALKPKTREFYEQGWVHIQKWADANRNPHVERMKWPTIYKLVMVYDDRPAVQRQVRQVLQRLFAIAIDRGVIDVNPWVGQEKRRWRTKASEQKKQIVRWADVEKMVGLCQAAGYPSMGIAVAIGFDLMQYPEDIIQMRFGAEYEPAEGLFVFERSKTGVPVAVPASPYTRVLIGERDRMFLVQCETTARPYKKRHFNTVFRKCMAGTPYETFEFRWLRHSGVAEADEAGVAENAIDAIGAWKPGGSGKAVRDHHYRTQNPTLAHAGQTARLAYRELPKNTESNAG